MNHYVQLMMENRWLEDDLRISRLRGTAAATVKMAVEKKR